MPEADSGWYLLVPLVIAGAGLGLLVSQLNNYTLAPIDEERISEAAGVNSAAGSFGLSFGLAVAGGVLLATLSLAFTNMTNASPEIPSSQQQQIAQTLEDDAQVVSNTELDERLAEEPEPVQEEILAINADATNLALQVALLVPILAGLLGLFSAIRMVRLRARRPRGRCRVTALARRPGCWQDPNVQRRSSLEPARLPGSAPAAELGLRFEFIVIGIGRDGRDHRGRGHHLSGSVQGEGTALACVARASMVAVPIAVGLYAWHSRPDDRFGRLLVAAGFGWFLTTFAESSDELLYSIGRVAGWCVEVGLVWLILAFPSGRLTSRVDRLLLGARGCARGAALPAHGAARRALSDAQPVDVMQCPGARTTPSCSGPSPPSWATWWCPSGRR